MMRRRRRRRRRRRSRRKTAARAALARRRERAEGVGTGSRRDKWLLKRGMLLRLGLVWFGSNHAQSTGGKP